jgi:hypothetical protein
MLQRLMSRRALGLLLLFVACASPAPERTALPPLRAGDTDRAAGFELPPVLRAADLVPETLRVSELYEVADEVPTDGFSHQYWISSRFGEFEVLGPELLRERTAEIRALAELRDRSRSGAFARSAARGLASPFVALWNLLRHPVRTLSTPPRLQDPLRVRAYKEELAAQLGVDPDSSNPALQRELDRFAWAEAAGGAPFALVPFQSPRFSREDQTRLNRIELAVMGVDEAGRDAFLAVPWWTPRLAARLVGALAALEAAEARPLFVQAAAGARSEADARFFARAAELLLAWDGARARIVRIVALPGGALGAKDADGVLLLPLDADHLVWTRPMARLAQALADAGAGRRALLLPGAVSPRARDELTQRGVDLVERAFEALR